MKQASFKSFILFSLMASVIGVANVALAQDSSVRIGYVSIDRIFSESKLAKDAQAKMQNDFGKREKDVRDDVEKIKAEAARLDKDAAVMSETDRIRKQRELTDHDRELQRKQRELMEDTQRRLAEERAKILEKTNQVLKQIVEQKKLDIVFQDAAYVGAKVDITNEVLQALNR